MREVDLAYNKYLKSQANTKKQYKPCRTAFLVRHGLCCRPKLWPAVVILTCRWPFLQTWCTERGCDGIVTSQKVFEYMDDEVKKNPVSYSPHLSSCRATCQAFCSIKIF